ncbi:MAG: HNH endonuclease [Anaerolineae bacterium]|nr:HNH endonuclease [Anaerolineae bacterium]
MIEHVEPHSKGGTNDAINSVTACNKCNGRKSNHSVKDHRERNPAHAIEGRYGEPKDWDGFASFFVVNGQQHPGHLTAQEKSWLQEIQDYMRLK